MNSKNLCVVMLAMAVAALVGCDDQFRVIVDPTPGGFVDPTKVLASSSFNQDNQGWTLTGAVKDEMPTWSATDGNPGGTIKGGFNSPSRSSNGGVGRRTRRIGPS